MDLSVVVAAPAGHSAGRECSDRSPSAGRRVPRQAGHGRCRGGPCAPALAAWIPAAVEPDVDSYAELRDSLAGYLAVPGYGEMFTAAGFGEAEVAAGAGATHAELIDALPPDAANRIGLVGDVDTVLARLEAYAAAGLDEVVLVPATAGDPGGERTLTALRRWC